MEARAIQDPARCAVDGLARARRRLATEGADGLETRDILRVLGGGGLTEVLLARLVDLDLCELARRSAAHLQRDPGLPADAARRLSAAFALGRRVERSVRAPRRALRSPALVHDAMASALRGLDRETFHVLLLDGKHRLRRTVRVSEGTLTSSLVHPREVFAPAVREAAAAVIAVHNHPSGDPEPSAEDVAVTRRLIEAGHLLGVPLLDHVVIADERWVSLRERLRFDAPG